MVPKATQVKKLVGPARKGHLQGARLESLHLDTNTTGRNLYQQLIVNGKINGRKARIMIDSGATGNFISNTFVTKNHIPYQAKEKPYELTMADESPSNYRDGWV